MVKAKAELFKAKKPKEKPDFSFDVRKKTVSYTFKKGSKGCITINYNTTKDTYTLYASYNASVPITFQEIKEIFSAETKRKMLSLFEKEYTYQSILDNYDNAAIKLNTCDI